MDEYGLDEQSLAALERLRQKRQQEALNQGGLDPLTAALSALGTGFASSLTGQDAGAMARQNINLVEGQRERQSKIQALNDAAQEKNILSLAALRNKGVANARQLKKDQEESDYKKRHLDILEQGNKVKGEAKKEERATQRSEKLEDTLRQQYLSNPTTKDTQATLASSQKIQAAAQDPSAAGDMSLIYNFMKMQDPGSTVREGEFATAQNAGGVGDRLMNTYNGLLKGERLNPTQRADFINQAKSQLNAQLLAQSQIDKNFKSIADRNKANPENIVFDFGQSQAAPIGGQVNYTPDVLAYAQQHGITPEQAQTVKDQRGGQ